MSNDNAPGNEATSNVEASSVPIEERVEFIDDLDLDTDIVPEGVDQALEADEDAAVSHAAPPNERLIDLLGGTRAAIEATVPPVAFVAAWLISGRSIEWGAGVAVVASIIVALISFARGRKPRAVILGLLGVVVAALIAMYTGQARDFFLVQILSNAASALAWTISIIVRWPFLGLIVGTIIGTKARWRKDPVLLRAYNRASVVWVWQYLIRIIVFGSLYLLDWVVALATARVVLTWPLVAACIAVSGWVLFRSIPKSHPGIRHPQVPAS